jgi:3'(2'), 5'-bisphosphate nucleotidase
MNKKELKNTAENLVETFNDAAKLSIDTYLKKLKIEIKKDGSPVSNGDILVNNLVVKKIMTLTPNIPIISEETVNLDIINTYKDFWLIDPIDGTKDYISGRDEYTINASLILNKTPALGLVGVPKKNRLFFSYGKGDCYLLEDKKKELLNCKKNTPKKEVIAVTSSLTPSKEIINKLNEYGMTSFKEMRSSYKFCVIATGEFDIYAAKERAYEWDYAAGHAIAEHAGAIVTTMDNSSFEYGKKKYKNLSLLVRRSKILND